MKKEYLFLDEDLITQSENKLISLTTKRIRFKTKSWGRSYLISIHLEKISSIEMRYKSWVLILLIGVLIGLAGPYFGSINQGNVMVAGLGLSFLCIVAYFITRKHVVTISSDGGAAINFHTTGMSDETLMDFINKVEQAKHEIMKTN